jgi:hypothetical protein
VASAPGDGDNVFPKRQHRPANPQGAKTQVFNNNFNKSFIFGNFINLNKI